MFLLFSLSLSEALFLSQIHKDTRAHTYTHTHTLAHTHTHAYRYLSVQRPQLPLSLSLSLFHTHTQTSITSGNDLNRHSFTHSLTHSVWLSLTHTHAQTQTGSLSGNKSCHHDSMNDRIINRTLVPSPHLSYNLHTTYTFWLLHLFVYSEIMCTVPPRQGFSPPRQGFLGV